MSGLDSWKCGKVTYKRWHQYRLLMWKNYIIHSRRKVQVLMEFAGPILLCLFITILRALVDPQHFTEAIIYSPFEPTYIPPGKIENFGSLPFLDKAICKVFARGSEDFEKMQSTWGVDNMDYISNLIDFQKLDIFEMLPKLLQNMNLSSFDIDVDRIQSLLPESDLLSVFYNVLDFLHAAKEQNVPVGPILESQKMEILQVVMSVVNQHRPQIQKMIDDFRSETAARSKKWIVLYSPDSEPFNTMMENVAAELPIIPCAAASPKEIERLILAPFPVPTNEIVLAAVDFSLQQKINLNMTIRFPSINRYYYNEKTNKTEPSLTITFQILWDTAYDFPQIRVPGPDGWADGNGSNPGYSKEGFLGLQNAISKSWLSYLNETEAHGRIPNIKMLMQRFPEPAAIKDKLNSFIQVLLGGFVIMSYTYITMVFIKFIISEKESGLKNVLKTIGVCEFTYWLSYFTTGMIIMLMGSFLISLCLCCRIFSNSVIFPNSNPVCIFFYFFMFSMSTVCSSLLFSECFQKANTGSIIAGVLWVSTLLLYTWLNTVVRSYKLYHWFSIIPNIALLCGINTISSLEGLELGLQWNTMSTVLPKQQTPSISTINGFFILNSLVCILVTVILKWKPWKLRSQVAFKLKSSTKKCDDEKTFEEPFDENLVRACKIRNLRKVYGSTIAVDDLNLDLAKNQITVLLGHNGAGKTTTTSILTGIIEPTSGTVLFEDKNITNSRDFDSIRRQIGLCPQNNILLGDLTPMEHLYIFCGLKGYVGSDCLKEARKYLRILNLKPKWNDPARTLSGGLQRKLCVGLALCGNSKFVFLDEPTSGMDPGARRALWTILQNEKQNRTILLTTHYMDEADILGDRVAIMSEGRLKCSGSPFYLKNALGNGYKLVMVKKNNFKSEEVDNLLESFLPNVTKTSNIGSELSFNLPKSCANMFQQIFQKLEGKEEEYGVESFGVSSTSLYDVFLRVCTPRGNESERNAEQYYEEIGPLHLHVGLTLWLNQVLALCQKQWTLVFRNPLLFLCLILTPAFIGVTAIKISRTFEGTRDLPSKILSAKNFPNGVSAIYGQHNLLPTYIDLLDNDGHFSFNFPNITDTYSISQNILSMANVNMSLYRQYFMLAFAFPESGEIISLFNNNAYHSPATALAYTYKNLLKYYLNATFEVFNHPLPNTGLIKWLLQIRSTNVSFQLAHNTSMILSFITSYFVVGIIIERVLKIKLLQHMAGVNVFTYWTITLLNQLLFSMIIALVFVLMIGFMEEDGYTTRTELGIILIAGASFRVQLPPVALHRYFELQGPCLPPTKRPNDAPGRLLYVLFAFFLSILPWVYLHAMFMDNAAQSSVWLTSITSVLGAHLFSFVVVLRLTEIINQANFEVLLNYLSWIPHFSLTTVFTRICMTHWLLIFCKPMYDKFCQPNSNVQNICCKQKHQCPANMGCVPWVEDVYDDNFPGIGYNLHQFFVVFLVGFVAVLILDWKPWSIIRQTFAAAQNKRHTFNDSDVQREANIVQQMDDNTKKNYNLVIRNMSKHFGKCVAVQNSNLAISPGECFGLLGVNGAGKTTTFGMLTGELTMTTGDVFIKGLNIKTQQKQVHRLIGYCPQEEAVFEELTGRETLRFFCMLRGIPKTNVEVLCDNLARRLLFSKNIDMKVSSYSGGTRRKLNTAIALIGDPPVVFLDEPTTGMDPVSKRQLWDVICQVRNCGKTIILTSHSMEECEALCTRVAIMAKGQIKCLGSIQQLKNKFAMGFSLTVKVKRIGGSIHQMTKFAKETFLGCHVKEKYETVVNYSIPRGDLSWSQVFGLLESNKKILNIEDYTLEQTTLEQVFLNVSTHS